MNERSTVNKKLSRCSVFYVYILTENQVLFRPLPATIFTIVFMYLPMSGLVLAFKNYRFDLGVFGSEWNGLENFRYLFASGTGWLITNVIFKKITQSIIFLPYFISWVLVLS